MRYVIRLFSFINSINKDNLVLTCGDLTPQVKPLGSDAPVAATPPDKRLLQDVFKAVELIKLSYITYNVGDYTELEQTTKEELNQME